METSPLSHLWKFFASRSWVTPTGPLTFNASAESQAVKLALDVVQRPSYRTFHRAVKFQVLLGGFANCKASTLKNLHPNLNVNLAALWRKATGERTNLSPFPSQLEFMKKYIPFHYLFERYGDVFFGLPGLPVQISDKEAQELSMLLLVLPAFLRVTIKRIYVQYFKTSNFDLELNNLLKSRKVDTVIRITADVRTVYNTMVRQGRIKSQRSHRGLERIYDCAIRFATLLIRGDVTLDSVVAAHHVLLYSRDNNIDTVCTKLGRLREFLSDVALGLDLKPLDYFLETGRYSFDRLPNRKQSDPLPLVLVGYEVRTNLMKVSDPHRRVRAANFSLLISFGVRITCITHFKRADWTPDGMSCTTTFTDSKSKRPGAKCQAISVPFYDHLMSPDRAMRVLDELLGTDRLFVLGYVPRTVPVHVNNYTRHTSGSLTRLIDAVIADAPSDIRGLVVNRKRLTPNNWRFTAEAVRVRADVSERCRTHAKQHKPQSQTDHYALTSDEICHFGEKLQKYWEKVFGQLAHTAALRVAGKRTARQTYGNLRKKRKIRSGLRVQT